MDERRTTREGMLPSEGHNVWYRIVGDDDGATPLLVLHGSPGAAHDYLDSLEDIAAMGRRVVFYDQLGCGLSERPDDPSLWTVDLFVREVDTVRRALGLDKIHLLGQSWGGMLAMAYMLTEPEGVASLVIASSPSSVPAWTVELARLRDDLPPTVQATLRRHKQAGTTDNPVYEEATLAFYRRHVCRLDPWPDGLVRSLGPQLGQQVYHTMNGPSEFHVIGSLRDFDLNDRLHEITAPTLVTGGRFDEVTPAITAAVHRAIPGSEYVLFEHSSHTAHFEERALYMTVLDDFLSRVEAGS